MVTGRTGMGKRGGNLTICPIYGQKVNGFTSLVLKKKCNAGEFLSYQPISDIYRLDYTGGARTR
jgi:hypothetical protein